MALAAAQRLFGGLDCNTRPISIQAHFLTLSLATYRGPEAHIRRHAFICRDPRDLFQIPGLTPEAIHHADELERAVITEQPWAQPFLFRPFRNARQPSIKKRVSSAAATVLVF